jgi:hypothetical protein
MIPHAGRVAVYQRRLCCQLLIGCVVPVLIVGCNQAASRVDPGRARVALNSALDGWKSGRPPGSFLPQITVQDMDWASGAILRDYKVADDAKVVNSNLYAVVLLTLGGPADQRITKTVTYIISTSPRVTVFRGIMN